MLGTHIVDTHKLEPRWFQEENDLFTRKCHEEVGRQNVRRLWWLKHSSTCIWSPRPQIVRNFNGPMSLFTVKDFPYTSFIARLFKIRIFESFMEMRPPIFGVIWLCDAATRFLKASPPHLTLRMQFLDSKLYWFADLSCHTREYENKRFPTSSYALPMFFRCVDLWCSLAVAVPAKAKDKGISNPLLKQFNFRQ